MIEVARQLAQAAADEVLKLLHQPIHQERKKDKSLVTEADFRADQIIRDGLMKAFPAHAVLTEETGLSGPEGAEYVWLIDPLDGTKAFAKGIPGFSVMVGLLKSGRPELGVVVDPLEGRVYEAVRGQGATHTEKGVRTRLEVSDRSDWSDLRVVVSTGFPDKNRAELVKTLTGPWLPPINSVGIKAGLVVRREADVYLSHHPVHYWDTCAPQIILEEAGGVFSKRDGSELVYDLTEGFAHKGLPLASNGRKHAEIISLLKRILG